MNAMIASRDTRIAPVAPSWASILRFLGPLMLCNVLQALSGTINNIYFGQMIGVRALAAVSAFFPIQFFLVSFVIGISGGASVVIGQAFGAGQIHRLKIVLGVETRAVRIRTLRPNEA